MVDFCKLMSPAARARLDYHHRQQATAAGLTDVELLQQAAHTYQQVRCERQPGENVYDASLHHILVPELMRRLARHAEAPAELCPSCREIHPIPVLGSQPGTFCPRPHGGEGWTDYEPDVSRFSGPDWPNSVVVSELNACGYRWVVCRIGYHPNEERLTVRGGRVVSDNEIQAGVAWTLAWKDRS